jgi:hypothetical protein
MAKKSEIIFAISGSMAKNEKVELYRVEGYL